MSLDMRVGNNEDTELINILEDESTSPTSHLDKLSLLQELQRAIGQLTPIMREFLRRC